MLPRDARNRRANRLRSPPYAQRTHYAAQEALLSTLMQTRVKSWGQPGSEILTQQDSVLYNGRIPQEITDLIFEYVMSLQISTDGQPTERPPGQELYDFCLRNDHNRSAEEPEIPSQTALHSPELEVEETGANLNPQQENSMQSSVSRRYLTAPSRQTAGFDWFRPDYAHKGIYPGWTLLLTCRRIYLDAQKFLARNREIIIFEGRGPVTGWSFSDFAQRLQNGAAEPRFQHIPSIHIYAQMYRLEAITDTFSASLSQTQPSIPINGTYWHLRSLLSNGGSPVYPAIWRVLHNLETFHLTIRRTDWFRWEDNNTLAINPYRESRGVPNLETMKRDMHATMVEGTQPEFQTTAWGRMFYVMANLKKLTITFETSEDKEDEMEQIVDWARTWRFQIKSWRYWMMKDNEVMAHLIADDTTTKKTSWRGLIYHWSDVCPNCSTRVSLPKDDCPYCQKREALMRDGKGPRLLTWTLTWSSKLVDPPVDLRDIELISGKIIQL